MMYFLIGCVVGFVIPAILAVTLLLLFVSRDVDREDEIRREER